MTFEKLPAPRPATVAFRLCSALVLTIILTGSPGVSWSWGWSMHHMLNRAATTHLPPDFALFAQWVDTLDELAVAADERKCCDPDESRKHYCDIDDYPEFFNGTLPLTYDAMVTMYGQPRVDGNGTVPWTIKQSYDLLVQHFQAQAWTSAVEVAADIGHYAGDMHNPMHLTLNYNGQLTGQYGIHSRHESQMTTRHEAELVPTPTIIGSLTNVLADVYAWIDRQYPGVALILDADLAATAAAGGNTSGSTYYDTLWLEIGPETDVWLQQASEAIASLWYSAWLEAGAPALPGSQPADTPPVVQTLVLHPVFPNPFNPSATVRFETRRSGTATVTIHDAAGRLVRVLFAGEVTAGPNVKTWNGLDDSGAAVSSGIYLIRVTHAGAQVQQKAVLVR